MTFGSDAFVSRRDEIMQSVQRTGTRCSHSWLRRRGQPGSCCRAIPRAFPAPLVDNQPMDDQTFASLTEEERSSILQRRERLMAELRTALKQEEGVEAAAHQRLDELEAPLPATSSSRWSTGSAAVSAGSPKWVDTWTKSRPT
jgi:hypothetical protein